MVIEKHDSDMVMHSSAISPTANITINKEAASYLSIASVNTRSLFPKIDELRHVALINDYDIIVVTESWMNTNDSSSLINIDGYSLIRKDRYNQTGGGIVLYFKNELAVKHVDLADVAIDVDDNFQFLCITLKFSKKSIGIIATYRPEYIPYSRLSALEDLFVYLFPLTDAIFVLGDLNCDFLSPSKPETRYLQSIIESYGFTQIIDQPTRITENTRTLLDIIITNDLDLIHSHGAQPPIGNSDHCLTYVNLNHLKPNNNGKQIRFRDFSNFNILDFHEDAAKCKWSDITQYDDIDKKVEVLSNIITEVFNKHAPIKQKKVTKRKVPWVTENVKLLMKLRDRALIKFKHSRNTADWEEYKKMRNFTTSVLRQEKKAYLSFHLKVKNNDSKGMWRELGKLGLGQHVNTDIPSHLQNAEAINLHFINGTKHLNVDYDAINDQCKYFNTHTFNNNSELFKFRMFSETEVKKAISSMRSNACGVDGISKNMLNLVLPFVLPPLTHIFNYSVKHSVYPSLWKNARVTPIPKKKTLITSYKELRPISIQPILSKVMEKLIFCQLNEYVESKQILPPIQSGFRRQHSTATALLNVTADMYEAVNNNNVCMLVLLDLSKAFDTVDHTLLLAKLKYYNISHETVMWFKSYFSDRKQLVQLSPDVFSSYLTIKSGVAQGSILGPLLYSIYTADLYKSIKHCQIHLYADDTQLMIPTPTKSIPDAVHLLNSDLHTISFWCKNNGLFINPDKSQFSIYGTARNLAKIDENELTINIDGAKIAYSKTLTNLGVTFDQKLCWSEHVSRQTAKSFFVLRSVRKLSQFLPTDLKLTLVKTLILPLVDYCDTVYGANLCKRDAIRVQKLQNCCVRFVFNLRKSSHILPFLNELGMLNMKRRRKLHLCCMIYKILQTAKPFYLFDRLQHKRDIHIYCTRDKNKLFQQHHNLSLTLSSFTFSAVKSWNALPDNIISSASYHLFLQSLRKFLLREQSQVQSTHD